MIVEVLLRAPMPADPLSPQSPGAIEYGKSLRALVYRGFKGTSITMPFQMGIHKKGELTNGDLVDFMIELDLRTNTNYSEVRQRIENAVSLRRSSLIERCTREFLPAPPLDATLLDWHRFSNSYPGAGACSPSSPAASSSSYALTSPLGGRPAHSDGNIAVLRHVRMVCLTSGAKVQYGALGYGLFWSGQVPDAKKVPSDATQRYGEMRLQYADDLNEARKLNKELIDNQYACITLSTDATGEGGNARVNIVLKIPSGEKVKDAYPTTKA